MEVTHFAVFAEEGDHALLSFRFACTPSAPQREEISCTKTWPGAQKRLLLIGLCMLFAGCQAQAVVRSVTQKEKAEEGE